MRARRRRMKKSSLKVCIEWWWTAVWLSLISVDLCARVVLLAVKDVRLKFEGWMLSC